MDAALNNMISELSQQMPSHLCESAWLEHGPFALWLGENLKPTKFVELGTHNGFSYFTFCEALKLNNSPHEAYAVDTWQGDEHAGFYSDEVYSKVNEINSQFFSAFSSLVRSTFESAVDYFEDGSIDLLHIDGLHTYEAVSSDFNTWLPKLSQSAIVLFHDINVRDRGFGVHKFWAEISNKYPNFSFSHGHGLGVVKFGAERTPIDWIFDLDPRKVAALRNYFATLGSRVRLQRERNALSHMIYLRDEEISILRTSRNSLESDLISERESLTETNRYIGAIIQSRSWKITGPLRALGKLFN